MRSSDEDGSTPKICMSTICQRPPRLSGLMRRRCRRENSFHQPDAGAEPEPSQAAVSSLLQATALGAGSAGACAGGGAADASEGGTPTSDDSAAARARAGPGALAADELALERGAAEQ